MNPDWIPDLHRNLADTYHTTNIGHIDTQVTYVSAHCIDVNAISYAKGDKCGDWYGTTLNTDTFTYYRVIMNLPSALSSLLTNTEYKNYIFNYLIYLLICSI